MPIDYLALDGHPRYPEKRSAGKAYHHDHAPSERPADCPACDANAPKVLQPCLKQRTHCLIVRADGRRYEATNLCDVSGEVCPRVIARCETGTGYELCGSTHAEANAAKLAAESAGVPGEAFLTGHSWMCKPCQDALRAVNVHTFHIVGPA